MFKKFINRLVDKRVNELIHEELAEIKSLSSEEAEHKIASFLSAKKDEGVNKISTLDIVMKLKIPANQVENAMGKFIKSRGVKEFHV